MSAFIDPTSDSVTTGLSEFEVKLLEFERNWWRHAGTKESAVKQLFNLTPPAYYQLLNNLIDKEAALMAQPILVKRLRRIRDARATARSSSKLGFTL
ncbi:MAG: hypothetical protein RLY62_1015 [Actinomycetota bacterium]|jgi:hypothetical protein|nr:DUF3263 domain-containing protein [Actinomycetota bacterium]NCV74017.1 DUF3263 domain-containing protein [Actinomycetota bacterium]NDF57172.1 DUF3263 domain-containing protein [Actinomycetota bacterium]